MKKDRTLFPSLGLGHKNNLVLQTISQFLCQNCNVTRCLQMVKNKVSPCKSDKKLLVIWHIKIMTKL